MAFATPSPEPLASRREAPGHGIGLAEESGTHGSEPALPETHRFLGRNALPAQCGEVVARQVRRRTKGNLIHRRCTKATEFGTVIMDSRMP